jgi:hypothetical protein
VARGSPGDQVPPLPRCQAQGLRGIQETLQDLVIHFCDRCGDYFARLPQPAPRTTTSRVPQSHPREGRGEAQGDGGGPRGIRLAVATCLDDGWGCREGVLSNHQREIPHVCQEAHGRQQAVKSARRTLVTCTIFSFSYLFCSCLVIRCFTATRGPWARCLGRLPICFVLEFLVVLAALVQYIYPHMSRSAHNQCPNHAPCFYSPNPRSSLSLLVFVAKP